MKTREILAFIGVIPLAGCYSVLTLNVGSANHEAASAGAPKLAPKVDCAALASPKITAPGVAIDPVATCLPVDKKATEKGGK
jgi:uncharacterized protein YceK